MKKKEYLMHRDLCFLRNVVIRHNYRLPDFTVYVYKKVIAAMIAHTHITDILSIPTKVLRKRKGNKYECTTCIR